MGRPHARYTDKQIPTDRPVPAFDLQPRSGSTHPALRALELAGLLCAVLAKKLVAEIEPRLDLTPDEYRRLARVLRELVHGISQNHSEAFDDLAAGGPPRPLLLRFLDKSEGHPDFTGKSREQRLKILCEMLGPDADSRAMFVNLDGPVEEREVWSERLQEAMEGLAKSLSVVTVRDEDE